MAYDAFISYSHAADGRLAPALEHGLERLARPWNRLRALSVFRDESNLPPNQNLRDTLKGALDQSRWFVLLASPESAASEWVNEEVAHWCDTKGVTQLIIVLTGGELVWDDAAGDFSESSTAVPAALRGRFKGEPLHLDLRWAREAPDLALGVSKFRAAVAHVAAPIRDMEPDELEGEDVRLHRRARRLARAAVAGLAVLTAFAVVAAIAAVMNAREADRRTREALARQLGLEALDIPVDEVDRALLLSLAASGLDPDAGEGADSSSRALIGRYPYLDRLLQLPPGEGVPVAAAIALDATGASVATSVQALVPGQAGSDVLRWDVGAATAPAMTSVPSSEALAFLGAGPALLNLGAASVLTKIDAAGGATAIGTALAADGRLARAVVVEAAGAALVDLDTGATLRSVAATGPPGPAAITEAVSVVVAGGRLVVLDSRSGDELAATTVGGPVQALAVNPTGTVLAAIVEDQGGLVLRRWQRNGARLDEAGGGPVAGAPVDRAFLSPDGSRVLVVGAGGTQLLDAASGSVVAAETDGAGLARAEPSARFVAVGGNRFDLWDLTTGQRVAAVPDPVNDLAWSGPCTPTGPRCRLATVGRSLDVWDPLAGRRVRLAEETPAQAVGISGDGLVVASAGYASFVAVWRLQVRGDAAIGEELLAPGGSQTVLDPSTSATARATGTEVEVRRDGTTTRLPLGGVQEVAVLAGGSRLLVRRADTTELLDGATGTPVAEGLRCDGDVVAASPDGQRFATFRTTDDVLAECRAEDGSLVAIGGLDAAGPPQALAIADDGRVAVARGGRITWLPLGPSGFAPGLALDTGFGGTEGVVQSLSLVGRRLAAGLTTRTSGPRRGRVLVWDLDGAPVAFDLAATDVGAVALSGPVGELLATASRDAAADSDAPWSVQVWETATRRRLGPPLTGLSGDEVSLFWDAATEGGTGALLGVEGSGRVTRWPVSLDLGPEICRAVGRPLTEAEWSAAAGGALPDSAFEPVC